MSVMGADRSEVGRVREAYARRAERGLDARYSRFGCGDGSVLRDLVRYGASPRCLEGVDLRRVSLAPPIARALARWSWLACELLEKLPFLRTRYLAAIVKRSD